jgi:hypothetical protein
MTGLREDTLMRSLYRYLAMVVATGVLLQAAAIAWAMFALADDVDDGLVVDKSYDGNAGFAVHAILGWMVIPVVALILLGVGFGLRSVDGALKWASIVFGLVVLQLVLAIAAFGVGALGGLHGVNALLVLLASIKAIYVVPREPVVA